MEKVLTEICDELNNYFWRHKYAGKFTIENGSINLPFLQQGQYFRVVGSVFNDGVHKYPCDSLNNEVFDGFIWSMAVPGAVIDLAGEIGDWQQQYGGVNSPNMSPFTSESFNDYSYSKDGGDSTTGGGNTWQAVYASRLNKWRRLRGI